MLTSATPFPHSHHNCWGKLHFKHSQYSKDLWFPAFWVLSDKQRGLPCAWSSGFGCTCTRPIPKWYHLQTYPPSLSNVKVLVNLSDTKGKQSKKPQHTLPSGMWAHHQVDRGPLSALLGQVLRHRDGGRWMTQGFTALNAFPCECWKGGKTSVLLEWPFSRNLIFLGVKTLMKGRTEQFLHMWLQMGWALRCMAHEL